MPAAARKRAAGIQQLAVKRHDAQPPPHLLLDGKAVIERIDDERAGQQKVHDFPVLRIRTDQLIGKAYGARFPLRRLILRAAHNERRKR